MLMEAGAGNRKAGFHIISVATLGRDGWPSVRTVVLRGFTRSTRTIRFHTDIRSRKYAEMQANPRIAIQAYDPARKIQIRFACEATLRHEDDLTQKAWEASREMSRACYAQAEPPGAQLNDEGQLAAPLDGATAFGHFAVVLAEVKRLEWLYLAAQGHRRAHFDWTDGEPPVRYWAAP